MKPAWPPLDELDGWSVLRARSGLLPRGVLAVDLDPEGPVAYCAYRDERGTAVKDLRGDRSPTRLAAWLIDLEFPPLLAIAAARALLADQRRNTRH